MKRDYHRTEGILVNDTIYKLNSDLFENLEVIYEQNNKYKDVLIYYKKALKLNLISMEKIMMKYFNSI